MKSRTIDWWRRRRFTAPRYRRTVLAARRSEIPALPPRRQIALVGPESRPQWAMFVCPCGRGHLIALNLLPTRHPFWEVSHGERGLTLHPSVDAHWQGSRCHFWLRDGHVHWVHDPPKEVVSAGVTNPTTSRSGI
jgi:hypothetical protein